MSIFLPAALASGAAITATATSQTNEMIVLSCWTVLAIAAAYAARTFRPSSIVGPVRLGEDESAFDLLIIFFTAFCFTMLTAGWVLHQNLAEDAKLLAVSVVGAVGALAALVLLTSVFRPGLLNSLGMNPRWIPAGLAVGAATLFVIDPLVMVTSQIVERVYQSLHQPQPAPHELLILLGHTSNRAMMTTTIVLAVVGAPITEELMYRGLIQTALAHGFAAIGLGTGSPRFSPVSSEPSKRLEYESKPAPCASPAPAARWAAVFCSAAIFAGIHMNLAFFLPLFVLALGLGYIYERTGNLWANIVTHSLFNAGQIWFFLKLPQ